MTSLFLQLISNSPRDILFVRLYLIFAGGAIGIFLGSQNLNGILGVSKYDGKVIGAIAGVCICLFALTESGSDSLLLLPGILLMLPLWMIGYIFKVEIPDPLFKYPDPDATTSTVTDNLSKVARSSRRTAKKSLSRSTSSTRQNHTTQPQVFSPDTDDFIASNPATKASSQELLDSPIPKIRPTLIPPNPPIPTADSQAIQNPWKVTKTRRKIIKVASAISRVLFPSNPNESWDDYNDLLSLNLNTSAKTDNDHIESIYDNPTNQSSSNAPAITQSSSVPQNGQQTVYPLPTTPQPINFGTTTRAAIGEVVVRQDHRQMQSEIARCLYEQQPISRDVYIEVEGIDILVNDFNEVTILELKTGTDCVQVLREAIGQLLEYQFFAQRHFAGKPTRLVAVSPLPLDDRATAYLSHLRNTYQLNIEYRQYVLGSNSFMI